MAKVVLSREAYADLVDIGDYGESRFGAAAADDYQVNFNQALELLADFPLCGEAKPNWGRGYRCLVCNRHRIVYRVDGDTVRIARILHHTRDISRHLQK